MANHVTLSSKKHNYRTPVTILGLTRQVGPIGLDPATTDDNPIGATYFFTPKDDGLALGWAGHGLVFVNPPYGRSLRKWTLKMSQQAKEKGVEIVALIPARVGTKWFQTNVAPTANKICFWRGRLVFLEEQTDGTWGPARSPKTGKITPAAFDSAVVYWGPNQDKFVEVFGKFGWIP